MADNIESYQNLFNEAEGLWEKIGERARHEFQSLANEAAYEILMDIAGEKKIIWDEDIVLLAKCVKYHGDVVATLDELVIRERKTRAKQKERDNK